MITPPPLPPTIPDGKNLEGFGRLLVALLDADIFPPTPVSEDGAGAVAPVSEDGAGAVAAAEPGRKNVGPPDAFDFMADLIGFADRSGFEGRRPAWWYWRLIIQREGGVSRKK